MAVRSLISRGSEEGWRYGRQEAVEPQIKGDFTVGLEGALSQGVEHLLADDRVEAGEPDGVGFAVREVT
ncbi:MAG: hypothetical protein OXG64_07785 [Chloroflexi bacterium]|nr:hypothetical protein [Chloroflexota bacterium]